MKYAICYYCWGKGTYEIVDEYGWGMGGGTVKCGVCEGLGKIPVDKLTDPEKYRQFVAKNCLNID